jgi:1-aminocyclopropane-1-carboxylate deaminase/D-cysteine desulfhydrase-like pyridoxal-dependent ACC family enzyme
MYLKDVLNFLRERLNTFPKFPLCQLPTPCHRLNFLSDTYGCEIYCKREDLTGFGLGGNKTRKLELLIHEAREHRCDTLVTSGGMQSNFCRITAAAGAVAGMSVYLILGGIPPKHLTGNLILNDLLKANIRYVDSPNWNDWESESVDVAKKLTTEGRKVFFIPIGGSVPVGGLVVGKEMTGWSGKINGISVAMSKDVLAGKVYKLALEAASLLGGRVEQDSVLVDDGFIGPGYAVRTREAERAVEYFARHEGIFLDHFYTGKAAAALMKWLDQGRMKGKTVLFIHTGGQPELFA